MKIKFNLKDIRTEVLSGITVALALVPEAVAFAFVAHVNPLVALYGAFFLSLITAVFFRSQLPKETLVHSFI